MKIAGNVLAAAAAIALPFLLFLNYVDAPGGSGWEIFSGADIIVTVLAVVALGLIAASFASDSPVISFLVLLCGVYVFAQMVPIELAGGDIGIGAWLISAAALLLIVGAVLAILGEAFDEDEARPPDRSAGGDPDTTDPERTAPTPSATAALEQQQRA